MGRMPAISLLLVLSFATLAVAEPPEVNQTQKDFEQIAAQIPFLDLSHILYLRPNTMYEEQEHIELIQQVVDRKYLPADLLLLLKHPEAKVRTLAATALFDRDDPRYLPQLVELTEDHAVTFSGIQTISLPEFHFLEKSKPTLYKMTVAYVAGHMMSFYFERAGRFQRYENGAYLGWKEAFPRYWEPRKDRAYCVSWFGVQLARATQESIPIKEGRVPKIHALRERIDQLPADDRTWVLLSLGGIESGRKELATDEERLAGCRQLGPDKLMLMLQGKIPSDDPDLQRREHHEGYYRSMALFVLTHAEQLLRPSDSEALIACELDERDFQQRKPRLEPFFTPYWAIAAARLKPKQAAPILHAAFDRFQEEYDFNERADLCVALWQLCGQSEAKFLIDWYYDEDPDDGDYPNSRACFIRGVGSEPNGRSILAQILLDDRREDIDWLSLDDLARVVNRWTKEPAVTSEELDEAWHPLGESHYYHPLFIGARSNHRRETAELEAQLADWRQRLYKSVPHWQAVSEEEKAGEE